MASQSKLFSLYYFIKPAIPRLAQIYLRRHFAEKKRRASSHVWPINPDASAPPAVNWKGWPNQKKFAFVLTHDVETSRGQDRCRALAELDMKTGLRSSFNFVPRRYDVRPALRDDLTAEGFEVGVHGLYHDGHLYKSRATFLERARHINTYLSEWKAVGFRSPSMHHNLEWLHDLDIAYDASTFDTDPFEPQSDGMNTIFPFWVSGKTSQKGYVELPYTLVQDFTLFILLGEKNNSIWKKKLDWVASHGGMALLNAHPDYMAFDSRRPGLEEYPAQHYEEFLQYVCSRYHDEYWNALPKDVAHFWSSNIVGQK